MKEQLINSKCNDITIAKGIGIMLMVVGHSDSVAFLHYFIYYFHMPLFFFCSGFFFNRKTSVYEFTKKRIKGLYIPYAKWTLCIFLLHNMFYTLNIYNEAFGTSPYSSTYFGLHDFKHYIIPLFINMNGSITRILGGFWFIKVLLWSAIIVRLIGRLTTSKKRVVGLILGFAIIAVVSRKYSINIPVIEDISIVCLGIVFYLCGYYWKDVTQKKQNFRYINSLMLLGTLLLLALSFIWPASMFCDYLMIFPYVGVALIGIYIVFGVSDYLDRRKPWLLYYIGNNTLIILGLHFLAFKIVALIQIYYYHLDFTYLAKFPVAWSGQDGGWWILYSVTGIAIPVGIKCIYDRIRNQTAKCLNAT